MLALSSKKSNKQTDPGQCTVVNLWTLIDNLSSTSCFRILEVSIRRGYKHPAHGLLGRHFHSVLKYFAYGEQKANDSKVDLTHCHLLKEGGTFSEQQSSSFASTNCFKTIIF